MAQYHCSEVANIGQRGLKIRIVAVVAKGKSNAWEAFDAAFHGRGHGSGINYIDGGIAAVVYSGHHQIDGPFCEFINGDFNAVDRCTGAAVGLVTFVVWNSVNS